jgi:NAD(P)-dependent dehydrogenase (short-subunit alcohol dehydrogenase family)
VERSQLSLAVAPVIAPQTIWSIFTENFLIGIGLAFVKLLHAKNCNVVIGDLRLTPDAQQVVSSASAQCSAKILFKETDVTQWKQLSELFEFTEKSLGAPDIVCPAAGVFEPVSLSTCSRQRPR